MAFGRLSGQREFLWLWDGVDMGWGTRIIRAPNYSAGMQRWRAQLTQTRDSVTFADTDQALVGALKDAGTVVDDTFALCGRLDGESYATLFTGVCKSYQWQDGVLSMSIANRFEELRSGRFTSNYRTLRYYNMEFTQVAGANGTELVLNGSAVINGDGVVLYGSATNDTVSLGTNSILAFASPSHYPGTLGDPWEFSIAGFPHEPDESFATSFAMRIPVDTEAQVGERIYTPEEMLFVGDPQTLIREFVGGSCTDVGWTEGVDFEMGTSNVLDQVELTVPVSYRANSDVNIMSVIDHICETTLISVWPDRDAVVHFVPYAQADLSAPAAGTLSRETGFKVLGYGYDSEDIVTTIDLFFGYNADSNSALDEWGGHKTIDVPSIWQGQSDVQRTRTFRARYFFRQDVAYAMSLRILSRHFKGVPQLELDCLPTAATVTIGDLHTVTYSLLDVNNALYQIVSVRDDWDNDGIRVTLQAGTSLFDALGFGEWEDSTWSDHAVSGTSTFGFGDGTLGAADIGTCEGIDEDTYGSTFRWGG